MDRTYADRIAYRKRIIKESNNICIGVNNDTTIRPAVRELYTFLLGTYLPKRYPTMFKLHHASFETGDQFMFENLITKQIFPTQPSSTTPTRTLLQTLGSTIDEDFLFLLPENEGEDPKYVLEAYILIAPSGWNPPDKLGKRLAAIHGPVPGYADKLEGSMDRYFKGLEVRKYVKRSNWSITQHEDLFMPNPNSNHGKEGQNEAVVEEIDPEKVSSVKYTCVYLSQQSSPSVRRQQYTILSLSPKLRNALMLHILTPHRPSSAANGKPSTASQTPKP